MLFEGLPDVVDEDVVVADGSTTSGIDDGRIGDIGESADADIGRESGDALPPPPPTPTPAVAPLAGATLLLGFDDDHAVDNDGGAHTLLTDTSVAELSAPSSS